MDTDTLPLRRVDERRLLQSLFGSLATIAGAFLLSNVAAALLFVAFGVGSLATLREMPLLYAVLNGIASLGFVAAAVAFLAVRNEWEILHVRKPRVEDVAYVVGGVVVLAVAAVAASALVSAIMAALESLFGVSAEFGENAVITAGRERPTTFLYMIPVALFVVGPGEELLFRGVVQGLFRRAIGVGPAILVASFLFGLGHSFAISSGSIWTYVLIAGAMGIVLGGIYEYTESIAVPAAIHGIWNAALFAINWATITYDVPLPF